MLFKPFVGVVIEHLRPQIGVVAGGIPAAPDVAEIAGAVTGRHGAQQQMGLLQRLFFEGIRLLQGCAGRKRVPLHVELRSRNQFRELISLIEPRGVFDLGYQIGRHGRAGSVMFGVMREHTRIEGPMFVELRRELHKVSRCRGARQAGIFRVGEHAVQGMAKFMEQGGHVGKADERRLARCWLREIRDVVDHRQGADQL